MEGWTKAELAISQHDTQLWHADCKHEIRPTDGNHLCLIYNLVRSSAGPAVEPPDHSKEEEALRRISKAWMEDARGPEKLVYQLEHM